MALGLDSLAESVDTGSVRGAIPRPGAGGRQWGETAPLLSGVSLPGSSHLAQLPDAKVKAASSCAHGDVWVKLLDAAAVNTIQPRQVLGKQRQEK